MPKGATNGDWSQAKSVDAIKAGRVVRFIDENYNHRISLTYLAKTLQISPSYLSESFKETTGKGFAHYVAQTRFEAACRLLREQPATSITEIAFRVGFQCLPQFNRVFKRLSGQSPREYRKALLENRPIRSKPQTELEIAKLICESRRLRRRTERNLALAREKRSAWEQLLDAICKCFGDCEISASAV
jgi:AraC-like DNA-binding protein